MSDSIDFIKQPQSNSGHSPKDNFNIDYTNPSKDKPSKRDWFGWLRSKRKRNPAKLLPVGSPAGQSGRATPLPPAHAKLAAGKVARTTSLPAKGPIKGVPAPETQTAADHFAPALSTITTPTISPAKSPTIYPLPTPSPLSPVKRVPAKPEPLHTTAPGKQTIAGAPASAPLAPSHASTPTVAVPNVPPAAHIHSNNVEQFGGKEHTPEKSATNHLAINLLPRLSTSLIPLKSKIQQLTNTVLIAVIIVELGYLAMMSYEAYYLIRTQQNQANIESIEQQVKGYLPLQAQLLTTANTLTAVNALLQQHTYWSNLFTILERYTLPNVFYTNVTSNAAGVVTLQAVTNNFTTITQQVNVFKQANQVIQSVQVSNASRASGNSGGGTAVPTTAPGTNQLVTFNITLQLNADILHYQYEGSLN